ncbi:MAG: murein biosynthesis integral membrane protein MurJ [Syntrophobacteraceae bacterium]|nr:murein biosynthesis integral membrane protein MurJ [Syntrophobacteraceae bacterium]
MAFWKTRQQMGLAAVIVGGGILLSRFMGLFRDKLISLLFGATRESDLYFAAFVIPDLINYMLAGGYFSITLIPFLTKYFEEDEEEGWRFFSSVFLWVAVSIFALTAVAFFSAPTLARLAAPGLRGQELVRLAFFLRIILPAQIFFLCGSCLTGILFMRKQFTVPAVVSVVYNLFIIAGGVLLRSRGMEGFCWGVLVGSFIGNLLLPFLAVKYGGGLRLRWSVFHPGLKRYFLVALPLMLGQSITVLDQQFMRVFGSFAEAGAVSWLSYARRIMMVPVSVVAQAAGMASFPFMADLYVKGELSRFYRTIKSAMQNVLTLLIPVCAWMILAAEPTIRLIFQQGRFGVSDTAITARLLQVLLVCVPCWGFQQVLSRAFYAKLDTLSPAVLGTIVTVLVIPMFYLLAVYTGAVGVAWASVAALLIYTAAMAVWWRIKSGGEAFDGLLWGTGKIVLVTCAALLPAWAAGDASPFDPLFSPYLAAFTEIVLSGSVFGIVFAFLSGHFIPELARPFLGRIGPVGRMLLKDRAAGS